VDAAVGFSHIVEEVNGAGFRDIIEEYRLNAVNSLTKPVQPFKSRLYSIIYIFIHHKL